MESEKKTVKETIFCMKEPVVYNWQDITKDFKSACEDLELGELVQVQCFLLFEAMSAIEIMDPKMDVGMVYNRKKKILNFEQSISAGEVKIGDLTLEEKIGIIDETYACLSTWLEGNSLAQTVFTNLYLHNPNLINDRHLKIFCFSILKIVEFIKVLITVANVAEDEVFQSNDGFENSTILISKVSSMLKDLEEDLAKKYKNLTKSEENKNLNKLDSIESSSKLGDLKLIEALYIRIKFTRAFYQYLLLVFKQYNEKVLQTEELRKKLKICESTFELWQNTLDLGIKPNLETFNQSNNINEYPTIMGFSQFVNQRSLPPAFPKFTKIKSRLEGINFFKNLIKTLTKISGTNKCKTFRELYIYCDKLSQDIDFQTCSCSRSILKVINSFEPMYNLYNGDFSLILKDDILNFVKPFYLQNKSFSSAKITKDLLDFFLEQSTKPLMKLLKITCLNRARQREKLECLFGDLSKLVSHADKLDVYFNVKIQKTDLYSYAECLGCWSSYYLLGSMIKYLLFGFELELYSEHEFYYIYWYLKNNLFHWMIATLVCSKKLLLSIDNHEIKQKGKNNKTKQIKIKQENQFDEIPLYNGLQFLTAALFKLCLLFMKLKIINQPEIITENHHILYFHRLSSFSKVSFPPSVSYDDFKKAIEKENELIKDSIDYIKDAFNLLEKSKNYFECIQNPDDDTKSYLKVVKTNIVILKLIISGHKKIDNLRFDFSVNKTFPVIKLI